MKSLLQSLLVCVYGLTWLTLDLNKFDLSRMEDTCVVRPFVDMYLRKKGKNTTQAASQQVQPI